MIVERIVNSVNRPDGSEFLPTMGILINTLKHIDSGSSIGYTRIMNGTQRNPKNSTNHVPGSGGGDPFLSSYYYAKEARLALRSSSG